MTREEAIAKIRKCLNLARDAGASQAEAERAMGQAEKLMRMYDVAEADAMIRKLDADDIAIVEELVDISPTFTKVGFSKEVPTWVGFILVGVCKAYDLHLVWTRSSDKGEIMAKLCGTQVDATVGSLMVNYLVDTTFRAAQEYQGDRAAKTAFRLGMGAALQGRLKALKAERAAPMPDMPGTGTSLVVLSDAKRSAIARRYPAFAKDNTRRAKVNVSDHYMAGHAKGQQVSFNKQVGTSKRSGAPALR